MRRSDFIGANSNSPNSGSPDLRANDVSVVDVLVVDDDPMIRHILGAVIKNAGLSVQLAASGNEGLEALSHYQRQGTLPKQLFLDLQLLDMTGADLLRLARNIYAESGLTAFAVVLSAHTETEALTQFPDLVYNAFLQKPFTPQQVIELCSPETSGNTSKQ